MALGRRHRSANRPQYLLRCAARRALVAREHDSRILRRQVVEPPEVLLWNRVAALVEEDDDRSRSAGSDDPRLVRAAAQTRDADDLARRYGPGRGRVYEGDDRCGRGDEKREPADHPAGRYRSAAVSPN